MARTIRDKLDGIIRFWTFRHISNAKMEGFNNKIRWLIKQAYGFRDREYFKLKIYQLPELSSERRSDLWQEPVNEAENTPTFLSCHGVYGLFSTEKKKRNFDELQRVVPNSVHTAFLNEIVSRFLFVKQYCKRDRAVTTRFHLRRASSTSADWRNPTLSAA